jgi:hypothetical protein
MTDLFHAFGIARGVDICHPKVCASAPVGVPGGNVQLAMVTITGYSMRHGITRQSDCLADVWHWGIAR